MVQSKGVGVGVTRGEIPEQRCLSQSYCGILCHRGRWEPIAASRKLSVRATIDRYKKASADSSNTVSTSEANTQFYQQEANKLRRQIREIQASNRQILGEGVGSMALKDLKSTEGKIEKAISRIRSKKNEMLFAEIELMQKRELELHNANMFLRAKIAENERAQQQMNLMPAASDHQYQPMTSQSYNDVRNFLPMNLMEPNQNYSRQGQTPLQLV